jgi:3-hydroxyisobutyrate dehydrogenase-like beta-hydroxyacid dehydrogenase
MNLDTIGVIGTTPLAAAIAARLASGTKDLRVIAHGFAPDPSAAGKRQRIEVAPNLFDLASECEAVIAAYPTHAELRVALTGTGDRSGLLGAMRHGCVLVDWSGGLPDEVRRLAGQLAAGAIGLVEIAQMGGVDDLANGTAKIYAGGFGEHIDQLAPILSSLGILKRIGPQGSARSYVTLTQAVRAAYHVAMTEAQLIAASGGFVPEELEHPPLSTQECAQLEGSVREALAQSHSVPTPLIALLAELLAQQTSRTARDIG